jgi:GNAT superfamily N-acetyltransferase
LLLNHSVRGGFLIKISIYTGMNALELKLFTRELERKYPVKLKLELTRDNFDDEYIFLASIVVKKSKRNTGIGTQVMNLIIEFSNLKDIPIALNPSNLYGSDTEELIKFYRRFGFKLNVGKRVFSEKMVYFPR